MPAPNNRSRLSAFVVAMAILVATPLAVGASHRFNDVPDSNIFHNNIAWLADAGVTLGCNPPANDRFCPSDNVTREQMAAFMQRLAENRVVDAATVDGLDSTELMTRVQGTSRNTEVLTINTISLAGDSDVDLATLSVDADHGSHALVNFGFFAVDSVGSAGRLAAWLQLDNDDCTLDPAKFLDGSLVVQDYTANAAASLAGSIVLPTAGSPAVTLCGRSVQDTVTVGESTLNMVIGNVGSSDVVSAGATSSGVADLLQP